MLAVRNACRLLPANSFNRHFLFSISSFSKSAKPLPSQASGQPLLVMKSSVLPNSCYSARPSSSSTMPTFGTEKTDSVLPAMPSIVDDPLQLDTKNNYLQYESMNNSAGIRSFNSKLRRVKARSGSVCLGSRTLVCHCCDWALCVGFDCSRTQCSARTPRCDWEQVCWLSRLVSFFFFFFAQIVTTRRARYEEC